MLFDTGRRSKGSRHLTYPAGHPRRVCGFAGRLPSTPHILESFAHYLYLTGAISDPAPLRVVAGHLRTGDPTRLLGNKDTIHCMAYVLLRGSLTDSRPYIQDEPSALRDDTLLIPDHPVDADPPAAYGLRDDFAISNLGR